MSARTHEKSILILITACLGACLLGGARDCAGADGAPVSVGEHDAGVLSDLGVTTDVDLGEVVTDMGSRPDLGPITGWTVEGVGHTDNDYRVVLQYDADDRARIAHYGEGGVPYLSYDTGSGWVRYEVPDALLWGVGCDYLPDLAIDAEGRNHYAYVKPTGYCTDTDPSDVKYITVDDGVVVGGPILLATGTSDSVPNIALDSTGRAHLTYVDVNGRARYQTVADGVASGEIDIGNVFGPPLRPLLDSSDRVHIAYVEEGVLSVLMRSDAGVNTIRSLAGVTDAVDAVAVMDSADRIHMAVQRGSAWSYVSQSTDGAFSTLEPIGSFGSLAVAVSPIDAALSFVGNSNFLALSLTYIARSASGEWATPQIIGHPDTTAEGVSPSIAYSSDGLPHIAFQGHSAVQNLFLASPL